MNRADFTRNIVLLMGEMILAGDRPVGDRWQCSREEQNRLYKIGRTLVNGVWEIVGDVVTFVDGIIKLSKHQDAKALDIYLADEQDNIIFDFTEQKYEKYKERILYWHSVWDKKYGGKPMIDKPNFRDFPHFES
jgi:hypothetical protein